jgi:hypothetical protein
METDTRASVFAKSAVSQRIGWGVLSVSSPVDTAAKTTIRGDGENEMLQILGGLLQK